MEIRHMFRRTRRRWEEGDDVRLLGRHGYVTCRYSPEERDEYAALYGFRPTFAVQVCHDNYVVADDGRLLVARKGYYEYSGFTINELY